MRISDWSSDVCSSDLWQEMADDAVLSRLDISQSGRWYRYRWQGEPPLALARIDRSSVIMHMIPTDTDVARALRQVRDGAHGRNEGWLVEATAPAGRRSVGERRAGEGGGRTGKIWVEPDH